MNEFGQKGKVPLSERLSVSPEEASALTGIGLTSIREAISSGDLKAKKHGRRTIILAGRFESMAQNAAGHRQAD
jgi:hypothetical protein